MKTANGNRFLKKAKKLKKTLAFFGKVWYYM